jgi:hypothetical protein
MEPMNSDWDERLNKARTNGEFIGLLNELLMSSNTSSAAKDGQEFSVTEHGAPLIPLAASKRR